MSSHEQNQPNDANNIDDTANSQTENRKRKQRSSVWSHYTMQNIKGTDMAVCNYCKHPYVYKSSTGTKGLLGHHSICKMRFGQKKIDDFQSQLTTKRSKTDESGGSILSTHHFNYNDSRIDLAKMITMHDYPLAIVEHVGFRDFCGGLQPLFKPITRNTVRSDIMKMYDEEKIKAMQFLGSIQGKIAITTDMWTSNNQKRGYMTVTSHFIDDSWNLQSRLLRFIYVPCPHTAEKLTDVLLECLLDWNIDRKLSTLTVDNCSTNNCMIDSLLQKMSSDCLILGGRLFHMRCAAHILNLIVRSGLDIFDNGIEKIRDSVAFWTATPKRIERFEEAAKQLGLTYEKKLALDCKTRWNSTYLMLTVAMNYKSVFYRLKQRESQYRSLPSDSDWDVAKELCDRLKIFYSVTEMFSGTKYPTSNIFFPKICEIKLALKKWRTSSFLEISTMASSMITKFDQYWKDTHGVMAMATLLDPRFKMKILEYFFPLIYGDEVAAIEIQNVRQLCEDIFQDYQSKVGCQANNDGVNTIPICSQSVTYGSEDREVESLDGFFSWNSSSSTDCGKNELDRYLDESTLPPTREFDVLGWWKVNGIKYPTLCVIAKDILSIPISTVASESSFSISGRIVSPHRSRLLPSTLEAIICTQNWLWAGKRGLVVDGVGDIHVDEDLGE